MDIITRSCVLFLWMFTFTFVKSQDCTREQFIKSTMYDSNFDTTDMQNSYPAGKQIRVSCNVGYSGFFKLLCIEGKWQSRGTKCQPRSCGHPGDVQFADFQLEKGEDFVFGSKVVYTCHKGEGRNQYEKAFGVSSNDLFQALYRSDEEMVKFMQLMNSIWNICGREVVTAFDLSPFKVICDLGGCSGALAKQCTSAYPECTVTIFDLPKVVHTSRKHFVSEADQRISFCQGDFFKDPLPEADLYILARILHDWTDDRCIELLSRVYKACKPGGAVLLVEALLHEDGSGPLTVQLYSLNMLVQTEGRERTAAQYAALLAAAGFTNIQHRLTNKTYDAVLGRKET